MECIRSAFGDDVHDASCRQAIFGRKCVRKDRHLLDRIQRYVRKNCLASPCIDAIATVDLEPGLTPSRAVGRKESLVHKHIALINGWAIGCIEKG